jgi:hypothetical protein
VHGEVQYANGEVWNNVRVNMQLTNGAQIRTSHNSEVYLQVNGVISTLKLFEDTELYLKEMMGQGAQATRTELELRKGTILGSVKKLSSESSFQVRGGGVTLTVRGGDFKLSDEGRVEAITGAITVRAGVKTCQLQSGEYFDSKKNEVGRLPEGPAIIEIAPGFFPLCFPPSSPYSAWPGSSSLSPFERGLENARHGFAGF